MATHLCALADIPDGGSKGVLPNQRGRDQALLVRRGGQVFGYINNCPHYDRAPLGWKKDEFLNGSRDRIMCSAHGALFRIEDGECVIGPCLGQSLQSLPLTVDDGQVFAQIEIEGLGRA
ncbi:Rieske (2Fe-2S) protein [Flavimaricola marinus]|nr:Rieske (2Fe-2S) protein [Flavimaricola marinus]